MEIANLNYIDEPFKDELVGKTKNTKFDILVVYTDDGNATKYAELKKVGDIHFYNSNSEKELKLKFIPQEKFRDNFSKIIFYYDNEQKTLLNSSKLVKSEIKRLQKDKIYSLRLEYLIKGPILRLRRYFGIDSIKRLKIFINIKSKKKKILNKFYNHIQNNLESSSLGDQERCEECNSLFYEYTDSISSYSCPTCLFMLSETIKNLEHATNAITHNVISKNLTNIQKNLLKRMDNALLRCINFGIDTPILVLQFLRSKIFTLTEVYFDEGLKNLEKLHQLARSDLEHGVQSLPNDFHDNIVETLTKTYFQKEKFEAALKIAQERFKFNEMRKNVFKTVSSLNSMAEILMAMKRYDAAQKNLEQSWELQFKNKIEGKNLKDSEKLLKKVYKIRNQEDKINGLKYPKL